MISPVSSVIGLKWDIRGQQHLVNEEACIIVSNHQSSLDILGMFHMWPIMRKCTVIAKKELFYIWPFGLAAWLSGLIFINRMNSSEAKDTMNNCTDVLIKNKTKLWVFPEGTRYNDGEIHPFKKGAFHVAVKSGLPILPVVFSAYKTFLDSKVKEFKSGEYSVVIKFISQFNRKILRDNQFREKNRFTSHNKKSKFLMRFLKFLKYFSYVLLNFHSRYMMRASEQNFK